MKSTVIGFDLALHTYFLVNIKCQKIVNCCIALFYFYTINAE